MGIIGLLIFVLLVIAAARNDKFHIGLAAIFAALVFGVFAVGLSVDEVLACFPTRLFLTLVSVTLLFSIAETNGTLPILAERAILLCRGRMRLIPLMVFSFSFLLSALGVGNIATTALMAPMAMVLARRLQLSAFLMTLVVVGGANAASLSPFSMTGILLAELMQRAIPTLSSEMIQNSVFKMFAIAFVSITAVHTFGFLLGGGLKWWKESRRIQMDSGTKEVSHSMNGAQRATFAAIIAFACGIFMGNSVTLTALFGTKWHELGSQLVAIALGLVVVLMAARLVNTEQAIAKVPWSTIILVAGVVTYLGILEHAGAIFWASSLIQSHAVFGGLVPSVALASASLSSISSSSGVVLPLFVPLMAELGSDTGQKISLISAVAVSAHLVDCSPFSTLGALCLASAKEGHTGGHERLFRALLIWGLAMIPIAVFLMWAYSFLF